MYWAEMAGTFGLVLIGPGAVAIGLSHAWISIAFGLIVTFMILIFGKTSGAHINPAVSFAFYLIGKDRMHLVYIPFQLLGAFTASLLLWILLPENPTYGETVPSISVVHAFWIEVLITWILMTSILLIIKTKNLLLIAITVGFVVFAAAFIAGPFTGASMNPARSFGPALFAGEIAILWLYFIAPLLGAGLAGIFNILWQKRNRINYSS